MLLLLDPVRADVAGMRLDRCLTLADFTGAHVDKEVATHSEGSAGAGSSVCKRSAWVGTEACRMYSTELQNFSQRDFPTFETREEAMDWLVGE